MLKAMESTGGFRAKEGHDQNSALERCRCVIDDVEEQSMEKASPSRRKLQKPKQGWTRAVAMDIEKKERI